MPLIRLLTISIAISTQCLAQTDTLTESTLRAIESDGRAQAKFTYDEEKQQLARLIASKRSSTTALRRQLKELEKRGPSRIWEIPSTGIPHPKKFGRLDKFYIENANGGIATGKDAMTLIQKIGPTEGIIEYKVEYRRENLSRQFFLSGLSLDGIQEGDSVSRIVMGNVYFFKDYAYESVGAGPRTIEGLWYAGNSVESIERIMAVRVGNAPAPVNQNQMAGSPSREFGSAYMGSAGRQARARGLRWANRHCGLRL